jgi:hypothetical protein
MTQTLTPSRRLPTASNLRKFSFAFWTDSLDMTLDPALGSADAAIIAFQVCDESKIPLRLSWTVRFYLADGYKAAQCEVGR